jgi:KDO2-lipid IV(A) lauroyltransferase
MTVAERLEPARLYDEFVRYRAGLGMHVVPLTGGPSPMLPLLRWVKKGGLVCLLGDRDLSSTGIEVELLGEAARVPAGPAVLARRTGAAAGARHPELRRPGDGAALPRAGAARRRLTTASSR